VDQTGISESLRVIAALIDIGLAFLLVRGLRRGLTSAVPTALMLAIPALGFAVFVVNPVVRPYLTEVAWTSFAFLVVGAALSIWTRRLAQEVAKGVTTAGILERMRRVTIAAHACFLLALSAYLYLFEPAFAVANLAVNAVWVFVWIPRRFRQADIDLSVEVVSQPAATWEFLVDASNALRYQPDLEEVKVSPAGPLQIGSTVMSRRRVPLMRQWLKMTELTMEMRSVVTELVPGSSYTTVADDRGVSSSTEIMPAGDGSLINVRTHFLFSVTQGIAGQMLVMQAGIARSRAISMQSMERLKELLSTPS
jgi:hypothetical protein